jgi:hypothetical protein
MPQRATASSRTPSADVRTIGAGKSGRFPVGRQAPDTVAHGTGDVANRAFVGADVVEIAHAGSVVAALRLGQRQAFCSRPPAAKLTARATREWWVEAPEQKTAGISGTKSQVPTVFIRSEGRSGRATRTEPEVTAPAEAGPHRMSIWHHPRDRRSHGCCEPSKLTVGDPASPLCGTPGREAVRSIVTIVIRLCCAAANTPFRWHCTSEAECCSLLRPETRKRPAGRIKSCPPTAFIQLRAEAGRARSTYQKTPLTA